MFNEINFCIKFIKMLLRFLKADINLNIYIFKYRLTLIILLFIIKLLMLLRLIIK